MRGEEEGRRQGERRGGGKGENETGGRRKKREGGRGAEKRKRRRRMGGLEVSEAKLMGEGNGRICTYAHTHC